MKTLFGNSISSPRAFNLILSEEARTILIMLVAICFLATGGIFVKLSSIPPIATGFYRVLFSLPILFPFVRKEFNRLCTKDFFLMLLAGCFLGMDLVLWNISFHLTTVANGNLLANLVPLTIIPVSYFIFKEKIPGMFLLGCALTIVGVLILMAGKFHPTQESFVGDFLAFTTSIFYAGFLLIVYKIRSKYNAFLIMFISGFGALFTLGISMHYREGFSAPQPFSALLPLIGLAIISQILGQGIMSFCLGRIRASLSSVIVLVQPVIAALYSFFIFNETLTLIEALGILIVLFGIYYSKKNISK